jgi:hypothetical protein
MFHFHWSATELSSTERCDDITASCKITTALESHQPVAPHAMAKPWTSKDESFSWGEFATFKRQ